MLAIPKLTNRESMSPWINRFGSAIPQVHYSH